MKQSWHTEEIAELPLWVQVVAICALLASAIRWG